MHIVKNHMIINVTITYGGCHGWRVCRSRRPPLALLKHMNPSYFRVRVFAFNNGTLACSYCVTQLVSKFACTSNLTHVGICVSMYKINVAQLASIVAARVICSPAYKTRITHRGLQKILRGTRVD